MVVRMIEADDVAEFVQRDAAEIDAAGSQTAAIRIPCARFIEDDISLGDGVRARRIKRLRHGKHARSERLAKHIVRKAGSVDAIAGCDRCAVADAAEQNSVQIRIPRGERALSNAVPVTAAVEQRRGRRSEPQVHDDRAAGRPASAERVVGAAGVGEQKHADRSECDGDADLHFFRASISPPLMRARKSERRATGRPSSVVTRSMPLTSGATFINPCVKPTIGLMLRSRRAKTTRRSPSVKVGMPATVIPSSGVSPPRKSNTSTRLVVPYSGSSTRNVTRVLTMVRSRT